MEAAEIPLSCMYDLAALANRPLTAEELTRFVQRSNEILTKLTK